jgi:hypothetical protein
VEIDGSRRLHFDKAFSTPQAPEQVILDALATLAERESTTVWLLPGACARLDVYGNLAIDLQT